MRVVGLWCALAAVLATRASAADDEALPEAKALYTRGIDLWRSERCADALPLLERSNALSPSPNSALLIARCRAALGRLEAAAATYAEVVADAGGRVAAGDSRYAATATTAQEEGAAIRARLGVIRIRVAGAPPGATVETDVGVVVVVGEQAQVLHRPGDVALAVRTPAGGVARAHVEVEAGRFASVTVAAPLAAPAPPPPAPPSTAPGWARPVGIGAAILGVAGFGSFVGFGLAASRRHDELDCLPHCDATKTPSIDAGRRNQTIANVSLAVGIVATAASIPLLVWSWPGAAPSTGRADRPAATPPQ